MQFEFKGIVQDGYVDIGADTLCALPKEVRRIDVREVEEFTGELGHVDDAESVPLGSLRAQSARWQKDAPLLLICRSGSRSRQAALLLASAGFTNLGNLSGGMLAVRSR